MPANSLVIPDVPIFMIGMSDIDSNLTVGAEDNLVIMSYDIHADIAELSAIESPSELSIFLPTGPSEARPIRRPPSWFGSITSSRTDTAERTEEILRAEFGQDDHR